METQTAGTRRPPPAAVALALLDDDGEHRRVLGEILAAILSVVPFSH